MRLVAQANQIIKGIQLIGRVRGDGKHNCLDVRGLSLRPQVVDVALIIIRILVVTFPMMELMWIRNVFR